MKPCPVCWIDFGAPDPVAAAGFFEELFGWNFIKESSSEYYQFMITDTIGGGISRSDNVPERSAVVVYIWVDSIDDTAAKLQKLGGGLTVPKTVIHEGAWYAQFKDPSGNLFGLFESAPK